MYDCLLGRNNAVKSVSACGTCRQNTNTNTSLKGPCYTKTFPRCPAHKSVIVVRSSLDNSKWQTGPSPLWKYWFGKKRFWIWSVASQFIHHHIHYHQHAAEAFCEVWVDIYSQQTSQSLLTDQRERDKAASTEKNMSPFKEIKFWFSLPRVSNRLPYLLWWYEQ